MPYLTHVYGTYADDELRMSYMPYMTYAPYMYTGVHACATYTP